MSNELQIFNNEEFGQIRTVTIEGEPWFVGKDVTENLGYQNGSRDINRHVDEDDRQKMMLFDGNQSKETIVINESGLYSLVLSSKLPSAKKFKRWVTSEVIPTIRKHGAYMTPETIERTLSDPDFLIQLATQLKEEREKRKALEVEVEEKSALIETMKPKEIFADAVATSNTSILIGDLAKLLKQNGYETGQKRLFEQLRQEGYLIKSGSSKNMPTQRAMEMGLFEVKESTVVNPDGSVRVTKTSKVTGKGQCYFINKFLRKEEETA